MPLLLGDCANPLDFGGGAGRLRINQQLREFDQGFWGRNREFMFNGASLCHYTFDSDRRARPWTLFPGWGAAASSP
jgi:hypothetical protein